MTTKLIEFPVTAGYYSFKLKPGQKLEMNRVGRIFIIGSRGKITDTGKNIHMRPVEFKGPPLQGDLRFAKVVRPQYTAEKGDRHPMFEIWKGLVTFGKLKFEPYSNRFNEKLFRAIVGKTQLIATSPNPQSLSYILTAEGHILMDVSQGPVKEVPTTAQYVKACDLEFARVTRAQEKAEELERLRLIELENVREEERKQFKRGHRMKSPTVADKIVITKSQSLLAMGLVTAKQADTLRKKEAALDAELNSKTHTKQSLADLAKELYLKAERLKNQPA